MFTRHGHRVIFAVGIVSLALLVAWWSVFINRSIRERRGLHRVNLEVTLKNLAPELMSRDRAPRKGNYYHDGRFEVIPCQHAEAERFMLPLRPAWPDLCLRVRPDILAGIDDEFRRKRFMLYGEAAFFCLLILLCIFQLYKFVRLEKRSTQEMEEFWGRVTHEIKTPITGIKAFLQSIKSRSLNAAHMEEHVDMALDEVKKQEKLAENILVGSRLMEQRKGLGLELEAVEIHSFLAEYFWEHHSLHLGDAVINLHLERAEGGSVFVRANRHGLKVILDNIIDNALKYASPGLELEVSLSIDLRKMAIIVSDNGLGFPEGSKEAIFKAYKRLDGRQPEAGKGSGMGLYISRRIARKMGGQLYAHNRPVGSGARFTLVLSLVKK